MSTKQPRSSASATSKTSQDEMPFSSVTKPRSILFESQPSVTVVMDCPSASDFHPLHLMRSHADQESLNESLNIYKKSHVGFGEYKLPTRSRYLGAMRNAQFHGVGVLYLPNGTECRGAWSEGHHMKGKIIFEDGLEWDASEWAYCQPSDRRFYSEVTHGLKPAGMSQLTNAVPPPSVPKGSYDTGDGFFDPVTGIVTGYTGSFMRYASPKASNQ